MHLSCSDVDLCSNSADCRSTLVCCNCDCISATMFQKDLNIWWKDEKMKKKDLDLMILWIHIALILSVVLMIHMS